MSTQNTTARLDARSLIDRFGFPHLLATTLALVAATILLGVATKATGSGLACEANWPQCDAGPYNLLPASVPSFYEWIHRFVAMFAGFAIIGSAIAAWRSPEVDRRVASLVVLGMVLTPVQVVLGRETVLQYQMDILSLHFWTAVLIFTLFVVATVLVWEPRLSTTHVVAAIGIGIVALPIHVALSPVVGIEITNDPSTEQLIQYAITLALFGSAIVATIVGRNRFAGRPAATTLLAAPPLAVAVLYFGRQATNPTLEVPYLAATVALLAVFLAGGWFVRAASGSRGSAGPLSR
ncbi:COX15/CtaA family protein [Halosolutus gelatinilyticus]|uniref:COX15/CtaA family protein n=1 Tax=Halosolutus gelatinilyticus TaxID=2931975 RepID=UPI001FF61636|nr:cytochrome oxidase assembly protein [Halosolutus gelatinilyticus]